MPPILASTDHVRTANLLFSVMPLALLAQGPCREQLPEQIASLIDHIGRDRDFPGLSLDQIRQDRDLDGLIMGAGEPDVKEYFMDKIFLRFLQQL
jgi:hypothetical protein